MIIVQYGAIVDLGETKRSISLFWQCTYFTVKAINL